MRALFILAFIANLVLGVVSLVILPSRVAIHFGSGGVANNWSSSYFNTFFFVGVNTFLFLVLYFTPRLVFTLPAKWINLPNKDYWLRPENKTRTVEMFSSFMYEFGAALFLFLFTVQVITIRANLSQPVRLDEKLFLFALGLFLFYTVYWCIKFFKAFRHPREAEDAHGPYNLC